MPKPLRYTAAVLAALAFILAALYFSVYYRGFDLPFYEKEYEKNGTPALVGMETPELMRLTEHMLLYLKGGEPELQLTVLINGAETPFFSDRELAHMVDVAVLFGTGRTAGFAACLVFAAGLIAAFYGCKSELRRVIKIMAAVLGVFLLLSAAIGIYAAIDFNSAWTRFHTLFFSNDLWLLDPAVDRLINIVPLQFFTDMVAGIGTLFYGILIGSEIVLLLAIWKLRKPKEGIV